MYEVNVLLVSIADDHYDRLGGPATSSDCIPKRPVPREICVGILAGQSGGFWLVYTGRWIAMMKKNGAGGTNSLSLFLRFNYPVRFAAKLLHPLAHRPLLQCLDTAHHAAPVNVLLRWKGNLGCNLTTIAACWR